MPGGKRGSDVAMETEYCPKPPVARRQNRDHCVGSSDRQETHTMDALKLLEQQHREVEELFESLEEAEGKEERQDLFAELADNLAAHATIEEKIFYPAVYVGELQ